MSATWLYRIASILYVLFAAGHTFGSHNFKAPTPEGRAVFEGMNDVHFRVGRATFSYGGFYKGLTLIVTVHLLTYAFMSWQLGTAAGQNPQAIRGLGWVFFGSQLVLIVLSWMYFSVGPAVFSAVTAICLGWAAWLVQTAH